MTHLFNTKNWWLIFIIPFSLLLVFNIWPLINIFILAFTYQGEITLGNFAYILNDPVFWTSLTNTLVYALVITPTTVLLSFVIAVFIKHSKYTSWLEKCLFLPYITSIVAIGVVWQYILNSDYGLINQFLVAFGLNPIEFLTSSEWARFSVCIFSIWKGLAFNILFYLIALRGINPTLHKAFVIDGGSFTQEVRYLIFPMVVKTTTFLLFINMINSFKIYTEIVALFGPETAGIANSAISFIYYIYNLMYIQGDFNLAAAAGLILLGVVSLLTWLQSKLFGRWI